MKWNYWDQLALVYLHQTPGLGQQYLRRIAVWCNKHQISPRAAWIQPEILAPVLGPSLISIVLTHRSCFDIRQFKQKIAKLDLKFLWDWQNDYPNLLRQLSDPPFLLYYRGHIKLFAIPGIAVIGARHMTNYGKRVTYALVKDLVKVGFGIISGFMYGVDVCAHQAAIKAGGGTIAVLGFGLFEMWPRQQQSLLDQILAHDGLVISEFAPDITAKPGNFVQRNRIVAALAQMVIVTEAAKGSGSHITTDFALDLGRSVGAVPGAFDSQFSQGTKQLINEGAVLVTSGQDVLTELGLDRDLPNLSTNMVQTNYNRPSLDEHQTRILDALLKGENTLDQLVIATQLEPVTLLSTLSELELAGYIQNRGEYYQVLD